MDRFQKARVYEIFQRAGYKSQVDVARALVERGFYEEICSVRSYLSQVLCGWRPASERLVKGLVEICGKESATEILNPIRPCFVSSRRTRTPEDGLELKMEELYEGLLISFKRSDWRDKMKMCLEFEDYVSGYRKD